MKRITRSTNAPAAVGPYSLAVIDGKTVEISGQIALTATAGLVKGTIEQETDQVMQNLGSILASTGCTFRDVTFATIYYTDTDAFSKINAVYVAYFPEGEYPARATVGVAFLPVREARVEISLRAMLPQTIG